MKIVKLLFVIFLFLGCKSVYSQELKVSDFQCLERNLYARTHERLDLNDNPCSIIRVSAANVNNFVFEGNIIGDIIYSPGEVLIYMPQGSRRITIKSEEYGVMAYEFPNPLEKQMFYQMKLIPLKTDPFSEEALAEANKIINRYWKETGLDKMIHGTVLPAFHEKREIKRDSLGDSFIYNTQLSIDTLEKKMFVQDYGAAYGRNGNKYWGSINGKLLQLRNKEKVEDINFWTKVEQKSIYEVDRIFKSRLQPFEIALFDVESPEWVFTIGESKIIEDKRYVGINKMNKITGATTMIVYFDTETGVIHKIVDYSNDTTTTFLEYQQYGDYFLRSKIKQVGLKNKVESIIEIKELCIGCPIDESLFKKKVIVRASDTPKAKKRRKADLLLNLATGVLYGI